MGERLRHLGAFPKCLGKKPSHPPARAGLRDFREEEFPSSLREVPLVWDVHQKIPNEIQCAPSDEIKLAGQVCSPNQGRSRCSVYQRVGLNCAKLHATNMLDLPRFGGHPRRGALREMMLEILPQENLATWLSTWLSQVEAWVSFQGI